MVCISVANEDLDFQGLDGNRFLISLSICDCFSRSLVDPNDARVISEELSTV
jgi:hypothetical protein